MTRRARASGAAVAVIGLLLASVCTAAPASAATYDEATWYYTDFNMAANLAVANGSGVSIALIDGSIDPSVPELANATIETQPSQCVLNGSTDPVSSTTEATHGTQMAVVLAGNGTGNWNGQGGKGIAPGATILHYRNSTEKPDGSGVQCLNAQGTDVFDEATADAITDAVSKGARVVNMSFGTNAEMPLTVESIGEGERKGVVFIGSTDDKDTPSDSSRLGRPGEFNGVVLMNGLAPDATPTLAPNSSTSDVVSMLAPGERVVVGGINPSTGTWDSSGVFNGSSIAAAFTSGVVADAMSRWPQATGNQIIQLMVRTTGGTFHEIPSRSADGFGFGTVSLTTMFENDPMQMPDENPLLRDDAEPSTATITGAQPSQSGSSAAPSSTTSTSPTARPSQVATGSTDSSSSWPLYLGIAVAVLVVLAIVVAVVVTRSRRKPPGGPPSGPDAWAGPAGGPPVHQPTH